MKSLLAAASVVLLARPLLFAACDLTEPAEISTSSSSERIETKNFRLDLIAIPDGDGERSVSLLNKQSGLRCKIDRVGMFRAFANKAGNRLVLFDDDERGSGDADIFIYDIPTCTEIASLLGKAGEPGPIRALLKGPYLREQDRKNGTRFEPNRITVVHEWCEKIGEHFESCLPARVYDLDAACKPKLNATASKTLTKTIFGVVFDKESHIKEPFTNHAQVIDEPK